MRVGTVRRRRRTSPGIALPLIRRAKAGAIVVAILSGTALASHEILLNNGVEPPIEFASDKPVDATHHLSESVSFGARLEVESESEINFDLDEADDDDKTAVEPKLEVALAFEPNAALRAYAEMELSRKFVHSDGAWENDDLKLELKQAYLTLRDPARDLALTVGRQYLSDAREWLLDEELDGAGLILRRGNIAFDLTYGREAAFRSDLLEPEGKDHPDYVIARAFKAIGDDSQVSGFLIYRNDREGATDEDLLFAGFQSLGELGEGLDFWADGAAVLGDTDGRSVRGFGFDLGVTRTFRQAPMRPTLTAAVAFGSGDDGSGTDTAFRQTGLQGNADRFGGVTSLHYYGELLDPELSNLAILTLGAGIRPTARSSVDLVYHHYLQPRLSDELRDVAIDADPEGRNRRLGDEIDLVVGIREFGNVDIELVGGVFLPGRAFEDRDPAYFAGITLQIEF